jgi:hypothetical protein
MNYLALKGSLSSIAAWENWEIRENSVAGMNENGSRGANTPPYRGETAKGWGTRFCGWLFFFEDEVGGRGAGSEFNPVWDAGGDMSDVSGVEDDGVGADDEEGVVVAEVVKPSYYEAGGTCFGGLISLASRCWRSAAVWRVGSAVWAMSGVAAVRMRDRMMRRCILTPWWVVRL